MCPSVGQFFLSPLSAGLPGWVRGPLSFLSAVLSSFPLSVSSLLVTQLSSLSLSLAVILYWRLGRCYSCLECVPFSVHPAVLAYDILLTDGQIIVPALHQVSSVLLLQQRRHRWRRPKPCRSGSGLAGYHSVPQ